MVAIDVDDYCESSGEELRAYTTNSANLGAIDWNENDGIHQEMGNRRVPAQTRDLKLHETGKTWGDVSRKDILCFLCTVLLLIVVIISVFVLLLTPDAKASTPVVPTMGSNVSDDFPNSAQHTYETLRQAIQEQVAPIIADPILLHLPPDVDALPYNDNYHKVVQWLISSETIQEKSELIARFVLGLTFYINGGPEWTHQENWMTSQPVCFWYGMRCQGKYITEVDLSANALVGPIHAAWTLLTNCTSIFLNANALTGTIPGEVFGNMQSLEYLYLKNNQLSGTVPITLLTAGTLGTRRRTDCS